VSSREEEEEGEDGFFAEGFVTDGRKKTTDKSAGAKADEEEERLICTLTSHTGSVLCVRFSNTGTLLASAGDDVAVLIYCHADAGVVSAAGGSSHTGGGGVVAPKAIGITWSTRVAYTHAAGIIWMWWDWCGHLTILTW
jgi:hypothetical protein